MDKKDKILKELDALRDLIKDNRKVISSLTRKNDLMMNQSRDLKQQLTYLSNFKVGDKVIVKDAIREGSYFNPVLKDTDGFVSGIKVFVDKDGLVEFRYKVNKIKKNGKMSKFAINGNFRDYEPNDMILIKRD